MAYNFSALSDQAATLKNGIVQREGRLREEDAKGGFDIGSAALAGAGAFFGLPALAGLLSSAGGIGATAAGALEAAGVGQAGATALAAGEAGGLRLLGAAAQAGGQAGESGDPLQSLLDVAGGSAMAGGTQLVKEQLAVEAANRLPLTPVQRRAEESIKQYNDLLPMIEGVTDIKAGMAAINEIKDLTPQARKAAQERLYAVVKQKEATKRSEDASQKAAAARAKLMNKLPPVTSDQANAFVIAALGSNKFENAKTADKIVWRTAAKDYIGALRLVPVDVSNNLAPGSVSKFFKETQNNPKRKIKSAKGNKKVTYKQMYDLVVSELKKNPSNAANLFQSDEVRLILR